MAVVSANTSFQRFDGKLDSILRKNLSLELYERLSAIESCIVVTHGGKKSQRLVILGHTALYFAEVPPKSVKRALELTQIVSSKIVSRYNEPVNDVPNFLSNAEKENVLHIRIFYTVPCPAISSERSRSSSPYIPHATRSPSITTAQSATPSPSMDKRIKLIRKEQQQAAGSLDSLRSSTLSLPPVTLLGSDASADINEGCVDTKVVTLDLYVLQGARGYSQFNQHLQVYLEDTLMRSLDNVGTNHTSPTSSWLYDHQQESLLANFQSLKSELLLSSNNYEKSASLLLELKQGAAKYYVLKKLFWQDLDIMKYCISQIPQTSAIITNEFDQIEYCIILTELLITMFTETHTVIERMNILFHESGSVAIQLMDELIKLFEIFKHHQKQANQLLKELAGGIACVFYEVVRLTQQASWLKAATDTITVKGLCDVITTSGPSAVDFLSKVVELLCDMVRDEFSKPFLMQYRVVSFIEKVILHSEKCLQLFRTHFSEEFRYIIHGTHSKKLISDKLNQVRKKILQL